MKYLEKIWTKMGAKDKVMRDLAISHAESAYEDEQRRTMSHEDHITFMVQIAHEIVPPTESSTDDMMYFVASFVREFFIQFYCRLSLQQYMGMNDEEFFHFPLETAEQQNYARFDAHRQAVDNCIRDKGNFLSLSEVQLEERAISRSESNDTGDHVTDDVHALPQFRRHRRSPNMILYKEIFVPQYIDSYSRCKESLRQHLY